MADFEYAVLSDENVDGFMSGNAREDESLTDEVREKMYREEIAEIARLREGLRPKYESMGGTRLTPEARTRGLQILDRRLAVTEAMYAGDAMPTFEPLEPLGQEAVEPRPKPKPRPKVGPRWAAKAAGLKYYTPNRLCKRGHSKRLVSTGACPGCERQRVMENRAEAAAPV